MQNDCPWCGLPRYATSRETACYRQDCYWKEEMTKSNSIQSFPHCKEIWDEAYASSSGIITVELKDRPMSQSDQTTLLADLLHYRVLVRRENSKFYPPGHPQHNTSIFDPFTVTRITDQNTGQLKIRIKKRQSADFKINIEEVDV